MDQTFLWSHSLSASPGVVASMQTYLCHVRGMQINVDWADRALTLHGFAALCLPKV